MQVNSALAKNVGILLILLLLLQVTTPGIVQTIRIVAHQVFVKGAELYLGLTTRNYDSIEGPDFIVKYTDKDKNIAPLVLKEAQGYYQQLQEKLGFSLPGNSKRLIVIYPDNNSLAKSFGGEGDQRAVGVYWAGSIRLLSPKEWLDASSASQLEDSFTQENPLTHELTHMLVDYRTTGNYTRWLTEGLAQYMEAEITGYVLPEPPGGGKNLWSLDKIESIFDDEDNQLGAYWQSRLTVKYLVDKYGLERINQLLGKLQQGQNMQDAFQAVYGFQPESLVDLRLIEGSKVAQ